MRRQKETYQPFQSGDCLYTSKYDVCRRQILAYKDVCRRQILAYEDGPHTERNEMFPKAVHP